MTSLPEQFLAARQTQLDNGFSLMRSLGDQALDRTSRVFSLQLDASRAAVEQSSNAVRQLLAARDPRDLLALGSQSQQQLRSLFDFSRELFSIAAAAYVTPLQGIQFARTPAASPATAPATVATTVPVDTPPLPPEAKAAAEASAAAEAFERVGADSASVAAAEAAAGVTGTASSSASTGGDFALPTETAAEPAAPEVVTSDVEPQAEPTIIARATGEALDLPVTPPHPIAASVPVEVAVEIELPKVEPVIATQPPAAASTGPVDTRGSKGRKKQH